MKAAIDWAVGQGYIDHSPIVSMKNVSAATLFPPEIISYALWLYRAEHYRNLRESAFGRWSDAVA